MPDAFGRAAARNSLLVSIFALTGPAAFAQEAPREVALPVVVITATRSPEAIARVGSAVTVLTSEEIARSSPLSVADVLRNVPGLDVTETGGPGATTNVRLRGANSGHTLVLIDGVRINDPASASGEFDFSSLLPTAIERIEVLRGPQSALYGSDAIGGVINIITKRGGGPTTVSVDAMAGAYGTLAGGATVTGGVDNWAWAVSLGGQRSDGFSRYGYRINRLERRFTALESDGFERYGGHARLGYRGENGLSIDIGLIGVSTRLDYDAAFGTFPDTPSSGRRTLVQGFATAGIDSFDGRLRHAVTVFRNETDRRFNDVSYGANQSPASTNRSISDFLGTRTGGEYQATADLSAFGRLIVGARTEEERIETSSQALAPVLGPTILGTSAGQTTNSGFALWMLPIGDRLNLSFGGRRDAIAGGDTFDTWRATAAYQVTETGSTLRASAGTGGKAPTLFQRFDPTFGNPNLASEHSFGYDVGIDQSLFDGRMTGSVTYFYNRFRNLIDFTFTPTGGSYFNVARARTQGVEVAASIELMPAFATLRAVYTYLDAVDLQTGRDLARRPAHSGRLALQVRPTDRITVEPSVTFVSERYSSANEVNRLPAYARLDLRVDYRVDQTWSLYLRGDNLTNARIEDPFNYGTTGAAVYAGFRGSW
jgi:vitamin B12 transporter